MSKISKVLIFVLITIVLLLASRNILLKTGINFYLNNKLNLSSKVESVYLGTHFLLVKGLGLSSESFNLYIEEVKIDFSLGKIKEISIENSEFKSKELLIGLSLKPYGQRYKLYVEKFKYKDNEINPFELDLLIDENQLTIEKSPILFFGQNAYVEGFLNYEDYSRICTQLKLEQ